MSGDKGFVGAGKKTLSQRFLYSERKRFFAKAFFSQQTEERFFTKAFF
jgi:hypothetical protein